MTPWNFPIAMGARKIAPALAAGCPVIAKPSLLTPISLLALGAAAQEVEVPHGLINILMGKTETLATALVQSEAIRKISFT